MTPSEDYRLIPLTQGKFAKVSPHRFEELSGFRWCAHLNSSKNHFYAERGEYSPGKITTIKMHRLILGLATGDPREGDHINGDSLDNRDENLRIADDCENAHNARKRADNTSGSKGVSWHKAQRKWMAYVAINGKRKTVGYFRTVEEAADARNAFSVKIHREFYCDGNRCLQGK